MTDADSYEGREQTLVKHLILRSYLQRFARIIAFNWSVITYVDCFSGPWQSRADDLSDTSFAIALEELRRARSTHRERKGKDLTIRCLFMERDRRAYERLEAFAKAATDLEIATVNASFEDAIDRIVGFARQKGAFTFFFIDPTGWKHLSLPLITPLLSLRPCEVLVNLMTGHVRRFVGSPDKRTQESLKPLFLDGDYPTKFEGLTGTDLDDAVVDRYCRGLAKAGGFAHVGRAIVLHPEIARSAFDLVYATRDPKGLEVFKDAERMAMSQMEEKRASAGQRKRERRTGERELFAASEMHDPRTFEGLRCRYLGRAITGLEARLRQLTEIRYDDAWALVLQHPLIWEADLKQWIRKAQESVSVELKGLREGQRVPRRNAGHVIRWRGGRNSA